MPVVDHRSAGHQSESCQASSSSRRAVGSIGQSERDVAQVEQQARQAARDVDAKCPAAAAEPDGVAEPELRPSALAGRQVDQLEARRTRSSWSCRLGVDGQPAGAATRRRTRRDDHDAQRARRSSDDVAISWRRSARPGSDPSRAEQARSGRGRFRRPGRPDDIGDRRARRRSGRDGPRPRSQRRADPVRAGRISGVASTSVASAARAAASRSERDTVAAARTMGLDEARGAGRGGGGDRWRTSTSRGRGRHARVAGWPARGRRRRRTRPSGGLGHRDPGGGRRPEAAVEADVDDLDRRSRESAIAAATRAIDRRVSSAEPACRPGARAAVRPRVSACRRRCQQQPRPGGPSPAASNRGGARTSLRRG
jgi:hypothetical protein